MIEQNQMRGVDFEQKFGEMPTKTVYGETLIRTSLVFGTDSLTNRLALRCIELQKEAQSSRKSNI